MLKKIDTKKAPAAIGPYSQAIVCGNMLFTSGQIPIDPATGGGHGAARPVRAGRGRRGVAAGQGAIHGADITEQAEQVMKNLAAVLEEAGTTFENAVKTTCFLADMGDFAAFNAVYGKYFTEKPARSCVAVKTLPKNVLVEVEVIAAL